MLLYTSTSCRNTDHSSFSYSHLCLPAEGCGCWIAPGTSWVHFYSRKSVKDFSNSENKHEESFNSIYFKRFCSTYLPLSLITLPLWYGCTHQLKSQQRHLRRFAWKWKAFQRVFLSTETPAEQVEQTVLSLMCKTRQLIQQHFLLWGGKLSPRGVWNLEMLSLFAMNHVIW